MPLVRKQAGNSPSPKPTESDIMENVHVAVLTTAKGKTRGKNPREIEYERFDREKNDNLPKTIKEFMEATGVKDEPALVDYLIDGFNDAQYSAASDEIGEFINDAWDKETQGQFRLAVRNFSKLSGKSIEDTVTMLKPAIEAGWLAKQEKLAAAKVEAAKTPETVAAV